MCGTPAESEIDMSDVRTLSLSETVLTLSAALDLVSPLLVNHHRRVAYLAATLAHEAGLAPNRQHDVVLAGLLHDVGAFSLQERMDTLHFELQYPQTHAERGYLLLKTFTPLGTIAEYVRYHHQRWDERGSLPAPIPQESLLLHLADRIAVLLRDDEPILNQVGGITASILKHGGDMFSPDLVEVFQAVAKREYVWLDVTSPGIETIIQEKLARTEVALPESALAELSRLFGRIIDFRSSFTALHSNGVAAIAERIAQLHGFTQEECTLLRIAGNLHDLGKLSVPRELLEKRQDLTPADHNIIKTHSYYTYQVLSPLRGFDSIRNWAAFHHERPDGSGYPFHVKDDAFDQGCRIVALADVFTALTENRPYRPGMAPEAVRRELKAMGTRMQLDQQLMAAVSDCFDDLTVTCLSAKEQALSEYLRFRGAFDSWSRQGKA